MTPQQLLLARQASREIDPVKARSLLDELCNALDGEREENRQLRREPMEACTERPKRFLCD